MNWIDRAISYVSPQAGLRRAYARSATNALLAYEGARLGRRTSGWITSNASANTEIGKDLALLRERSRDLIRNNHFAAKAALEFSTKTVGAGITVRSDDERAMELWRGWQPMCSADGLPHFAAIQSLVARTLFESGEVLVRKRTRNRTAADGMIVPLQLQVMEPDFLDMSKSGELTGGNYAIQGVEFNPWGQRVAYWLFPQHPGESISRSRLTMQSRRVPADEVIHIYEMMRPGQVRGVPYLAPVMLAMRDLDDWEDAEILRKKTEACLAAIVVDPTGDKTIGANSATGPLTDATGRRVESFSPGMIAYGDGGFDVRFNDPKFAGGYADYKRSRVRDFAIGVGMIYEILAGDLSQVNYSSYRSGLLGFRDRIEYLQWSVLIPMLCETTWRWFLEYATGFSGLRDVQRTSTWQPPAFDLLDREIEAKADSLMLANGTMSWPQAVQRQGEDPEKQITEIEKWKPRLDAAGLSFNPKGAPPDGANNQTPNPAA